jgi:hypothetical protein
VRRGAAPSPAPLATGPDRRGVAALAQALVPFDDDDALDRF